MSRIFQYIYVIRCRLLGMLVKLYLLALGCKVGRGLKCESFPVFKDIPKGNISIGSHVAIGRSLVLEIARGGSLEIGDHVTIGDFNRLSTTSKIQINDWVAIAEMVSIRGSFHDTSKGIEIVKQGTSAKPITVGRDCLLGAQTIVLGGVNIPDGVIIGAQSLVKRGDKLHADGIFAGSPLKYLRDRV